MAFRPPRQKLKVTPKMRKQISAALERPVKNWEVQLLEKSIYDLKAFTATIYRWAVERKFGHFTAGAYIWRMCDFLMQNNWTLYVGPRAHFKSMRFYDLVLWDLWRYKFLPLIDPLHTTRDFRVLYGSYKKNLADEHILQIKELVKNSIMPDLGLSDHKKDAETLATWTWDGGKHKFRIKTFGMLEGLRGGHSERVYVDDPFKDPKSITAPTGIFEINGLFTGTVMSIPVDSPYEMGQLHVIGTPQTEVDFFYDPNILRAFTRPDGSPSYLYERAIMHKDGQEVPLWPEMYPLEKLYEMRRSRKVRLQGGTISLFEQEYMCQPRSSATSYFSHIKIIPDQNMRNLVFATRQVPEFIWSGKQIIAGYDPGKKVHPAHFVVLHYMNRHYFQLLSKWFDHVDYAVPDQNTGYSQFSYINKAVNFFGIGVVYGDNTHGELAQAEELGNQGSETSTIFNLQPITINREMKTRIGIELDTVLSSGRLHLVDDDRQVRSLNAVQGDLSIVEGTDHHGEGFTSLGLPIVHMEAQAGRMNIAQAPGMFFMSPA